MIFRTLLLLSSLTAASASRSEESGRDLVAQQDRRLQLPDFDGSSITKLVEEFGEDILDSIDDAVGDWPIFEDDFSPFNELSDLLVPIVNDIMSDLIGEFFDPLDLGISADIDIGKVTLPLEICTATATLTADMEPITGLSQLEIMALNVTDRKINLALDESKFQFTLLFKAGFPDGTIKTGLNSQMFIRVCGVSFELNAGADLLLDGPTVQIEIKFKGKISITDGLTKIVLRRAKVKNILFVQEDTSVLLDAAEFDQDEASGLESMMSRQLGEDISNSGTNGELGTMLKEVFQTKFNSILPIKIKQFT